MEVGGFLGIGEFKKKIIILIIIFENLNKTAIMDHTNVNYSSLQDLQDTLYELQYNNSTSGKTLYDLQRNDTSGSNYIYCNGIYVPKQKFFIIRSCDTKYHYFCGSCDHRTIKQNTMSMHVAMNHSSRKPHICHHCNETFSVKFQLQQHIKHHHSEAVLNCEHEGCCEKFKTKSLLIFHYVRKHMNKKLLFKRDKDKFYVKQMICLHCGDRFRNPTICYHVGICSPLSPFSK